MKRALILFRTQRVSSILRSSSPFFEEKHLPTNYKTILQRLIPLKLQEYWRKMNPQFSLVNIVITAIITLAITQLWDKIKREINRQAETIKILQSILYKIKNENKLILNEAYEKLDNYQARFQFTSRGAKKQEIIDRCNNLSYKLDDALAELCSFKSHVLNELKDGLDKANLEKDLEGERAILKAAKYLILSIKYYQEGEDELVKNMAGKAIKALEASTADVLTIDNERLKKIRAAAYNLKGLGYGFAPLTEKDRQGNIYIIEQQECFKRAIDNDAANPYLLINQGFAILRAIGIRKDLDKTLEEARSFFEQAFALRAENPGILNATAIILTQSGAAFNHEAIGYFTRAIQNSYDSPNPGFYCNRGKTWRALGEFNKALLDLDEAIKLDPENPDYFLARGVTLTRLKKYEKASEDFTHAVQISPDISPSNINMTVCFWMRYEGEAILNNRTSSVASRLRAIEHLKMVNDYLTKHHIDGEMLYLDEELTVRDLKQRVTDFLVKLEKNVTRSNTSFLSTGLTIFHREESIPKQSDGGYSQFTKLLN